MIDFQVARRPISTPAAAQNSHHVFLMKTPGNIR
jgi:hypothetical protein